MPICQQLARYYILIPQCSLLKDYGEVQRRCPYELWTHSFCKTPYQVCEGRAWEVMYKIYSLITWTEESIHSFQDLYVAWVVHLSRPETKRRATVWTAHKRNGVPPHTGKSTHCLLEVFPATPAGKFLLYIRACTHSTVGYFVHWRLAFCTKRSCLHRIGGVISFRLRLTTWRKL